MDEHKKYTSITIPQRDTHQVQPSASTGNPGIGTGAQSSAAKFAEIEVDFDKSSATAAERALRFFTSVTQPVQLEQKPPDPLRRKFFDMRSLASNRPFARDDSELFYKQAKYMEDFTDDFQGDAKFFMYFPHFQHMGYEQLRTYFTWRTKARLGRIAPISVSYVFLYIYELLNNIHVQDPSEGLEGLVAIWNTCLKFAPAIENYLPQWFKDYHIYYELPHSFSDFAEKHDLIGYYSTLFLLQPGIGNTLELWNSLSSYDVTKSKFYADGNERLFEDCFLSVVDGLRELCAGDGLLIDDLFIYSVSKTVPWQPFKQALFHNRQGQRDRTVELSGYERYYCKNGRWTASLPVYYSTQKDFVGYIIKKTEACLRQAVDYKYKLKAEPGTRAGSMLFELKKLSSMQKGLDEAIEQAVADFHKYINRTVVTVDHMNLDRIRMEAQGTQEKLFVPDDDYESAIIPTAEWSAGVPETESGWVAFKEALSPVERGALLLAIQGGDLKAYADGNGIMPEVLADSINEKAADLIGDSILDMDCSMAIYDEYKDSVSRLWG